jgi:hypothetical protein
MWKKSLRYILRAIVMLFLRALKVIPVNPQIHGNVMCPPFVLNFIFEPLFVHDWRCNMDYSLLWSAFKMKTKNLRITSIIIWNINFKKNSGTYMNKKKCLKATDIWAVQMLKFNCSSSVVLQNAENMSKSNIF